MIKIISGKFGGRAIETPDGRQTRPTTNRVREAVFNSLCSNYSNDMTLSGAVVLDMFAGSGALGFEALSRGAKFVTLCDKSAKALSVIKKNADSLKVDSATYEVAKFDSLKPNTYHPQLDLIFADPPYAFSAQVVREAIDGLINLGSVKNNALLYYEHDIETDVSCFSRDFKQIYSKKCADIFVLTA